MKKLLIALLFVFVMAVPVMAADYSKEILPGLDFGLISMDSGAFWRVKADKLSIGAQFTALDYKNLILAKLGTIADEQGTPPAIAGLTLNINTICGMLGLGYHLPANAQIGLFAAWNLSIKRGEPGRNDWGWNFVIPFSGPKTP